MTIQLTSTPQLTPLFDDIYIAGNFNDWDSGSENYKLEESNGMYSISIVAEEGASLEFKFTRGSWDSVEGNSSGTYVENRTATYHSGESLSVEIAGWEDIPGNHTISPHVRILKSNFYMPQLDRYRRIWITIPSDYATSDLSYPVVYMHDGQNLFDVASSFAGEWRVDETMALPSMSGCKQAIFVGIDNGGMLRLRELSPWSNSEYNDGGEGDEYIDFIVETLKPFIDEHFRTFPERDYTTITGSSLGGLISMYAIAKHNEVFSKAGIFSPAFWFNPEIFDFVENNPLSADSKVYFVCGTNESQSMVQQMQEMKNLISSTVSPENIAYLTVQGGQHNEGFWAAQFPAAHHFLADCNTTSVNSILRDIPEINIFPNPTHDSIHINLKGGQLTRLTIYQQDGKMVLSNKNPQSNTIDISKLPADEYRIQAEYKTTDGKKDYFVRSVIKL